ncbi:MAG TPA: hypothetical protein VE177_05020 [Candidatus Binatus sp.]|nr:hypothetical protein [Candidatus Binatus sp.]
MRLPLLLLLLTIPLVASINIPRTSYALTTQDSSKTAWTDIVAAFQTLQTADTDGAPHDKIVALSNELNTALAYWLNATIYGVRNDTITENYYSGLSIRVASDVTNQASRLDMTAKSEQIIAQEVYYGTGFPAAIVSSLLIVEKDRIRQFLHLGRRRMASIETRHG